MGTQLRSPRRLTKGRHGETAGESERLQRSPGRTGKTALWTRRPRGDRVGPTSTLLSLKMWLNPEMDPPLGKAEFNRKKEEKLHVALKGEESWAPWRPPHPPGMQRSSAIKTANGQHSGLGQGAQGRSLHNSQL